MVVSKVRRRMMCGEKRDVRRDGEREIAII